MNTEASSDSEVKLSKYCLADHFVKVGDPDYDRLPGHSPIWLVRGALMYLDRKMHFSGFRGLIWRALGVSRSHKNPNICNF